MPRKDVGPAPLLVLGVDREQEAGLRGLLLLLPAVKFARLAVALGDGADLDHLARSPALAPRPSRVAQGLGVDSAAGADADLGPGDLVGRAGVVERGLGVAAAAVRVCGRGGRGGRWRLNVHRRAVELGLFLWFYFFVRFWFPGIEHISLSLCTERERTRKAQEAWARRRRKEKEANGCLTVVRRHLPPLPSTFFQTHLLPPQGRCLQDLGHGGVAVALALGLDGGFGEGDAVLEVELDGED